MNSQVDIEHIREKMRDDDVLDNARIAYRVAVQLWTYEGSASWSRFNVMLVANSILVGVTGSALANNVRTFWLLSLPIAGIVLCPLWWAILRRGMAYQFHYTHSARYLEELLDEPMTTVRDGARLGDGHPVEYVGATCRTHSMSDLGRLKMRWSAAAVIALFLIVNLVMAAAIACALCTQAA